MERILDSNAQGYNCYQWLNPPTSEAYARIPKDPDTGRKRPIKGCDIDRFEWLFADFDLKSGSYDSIDAFIEAVAEYAPTKIITSGNGCHAYWQIRQTDAMSFLKLNRRISTLLRTDPAVSTVNQLVRVPGTMNVKTEGQPKLCEILFEDSTRIYEAEEVDKWLPPISPEDLAYCERHYSQAYEIDESKLIIPDKLPAKFMALMRSDKDVKSLWSGQGNAKDRSTADFKLGAILCAHGLTREEGLAVLVNTAKAAERSKVHQLGYAQGIVDKIWEEASTEKPAPSKRLSRSMSEILAQDGEPEGVRFPCAEYVDGTAAGFRLGQVMGLVGGFGNGKSTNALNLMRWFTEKNINKNYLHVYFTLEQTEREIAKKWQKMSADLKAERPDVDFDSAVHVVGNYNADGTYRELGLDEMAAEIATIEKETGRKVGACTVDHIGIIRQDQGQKAKGEYTGLRALCKRLKSFAIQTNTFFIVQSQTSRDKNGGGDCELNMDAAFGCSDFEAFCDHLMTTWQPLKRLYPTMTDENRLAVTAFKFAKIRHSDMLADRIKQDAVYGLVFDPRTELLRPLTSDEHTAYDYRNSQATVLRNKDRKREPSKLTEITWIAVPIDKTKKRSK